MTTSTGANFVLPAPATDIVDTYTGLDIAAPAFGGDSAYEVTDIRVSLTVLTEETMSDADREDGNAPGDVFADVSAHGYPLTKAGARSKSQGRTLVGGHFYEETRWNWHRAALLASCERHRIDPAKVRDASIATWAEHQAEQQDRLMAQFGITK